ncbi:hypothetical protein QLX08_000410 [Tetragonisca angustula]|uniref:Uncharacterized protein n=1 Tax=Tetragonisca angustula TaxID=166442 RepID=A0AAW1AIN3_9HYME
MEQLALRFDLDQQGNFSPNGESSVSSNERLFRSDLRDISDGEKPVRRFVGFRRREAARPAADRRGITATVSRFGTIESPGVAGEEQRRLLAGCRRGQKEERLNEALCDIPGAVMSKGAALTLDALDLP